MIKKAVLLTLSFSCAYCYSQEKSLFLIGGEIGGMYSSNNISNLNINSSGTSSGGFTPTNLIGTWGENSGDFRTFYIDMNQSILMYLSGRLLTGLEVSILSESNKYDSKLIFKDNTLAYLISPCVRYMVYQGLYGQLQYYYGISHEKIKSNWRSVAGPTGFYQYDYSTDIKAKTNGFGISVGYLYPVGSNMNIDVSLKYVMNKNKFDYENKSEDGNYNLKQNTILLSIGLKYIFKRAR